MNYLAHIYLSGSNERIQIGNFMGDGVRGRDYENFATDIKIGILHHRSIDEFTDFHPIFRKTKHRFAIEFNHFSGIIADIIYDHFLAKNWKTYANIPLENFTQNFYETLEKHHDELNDKTKRMLPYLIKNDWLYNYQFIEAIETTLGQMDKRFNSSIKMKDAIKTLEADYDLYEEEFTVFFENLRVFATEKRIELENTFSYPK